MKTSNQNWTGNTKVCDDADTEARATKIWNILSFVKANDLAYEEELSCTLSLPKDTVSPQVWQLNRIFLLQAHSQTINYRPIKDTYNHVGQIPFLLTSFYVAPTLYTARLLWPAMWYPNTQLLHWHLYWSNCELTLLLPWSTHTATLLEYLRGYSKVALELLQRSSTVTSV